MTAKETEKLSSVARLLREALSIMEGVPEKSGSKDELSNVLAGALLKIIQKPSESSGRNDVSVDFLLKILQAESDRLDEEKKELSKKIAEITIKTNALANKEKELADLATQLSKLEAQLRIRENQLQRREETLNRGARR